MATQNLATRIFQITREGNLLELKKLLHGVGEHLLFVGDENGLCVLHHAASVGHLDIVQYILGNHPTFEVDHRSNNGFTAASFAALAGRTDILEVLIRHGASAEICLSQILDVADERVITFLCEASATQHQRVVQQSLPHVISAPPASLKDVEVQFSGSISSVQTHLHEERVKEVEQELEHWIKRSQELEDRLNCAICLENQANTVFLSCAHLVACLECAEMISQKNNKCPACDRDIAQILRIYRM